MLVASHNRATTRPIFIPVVTEASEGKSFSQPKTGKRMGINIQAHWRVYAGDGACVSTCRPRSIGNTYWVKLHAVVLCFRGHHPSSCLQDIVLTLVFVTVLLVPAPAMGCGASADAPVHFDLHAENPQWEQVVREAQQRRPRRWRHLSSDDLGPPATEDNVVADLRSGATRDFVAAMAPPISNETPAAVARFESTISAYCRTTEGASKEATEPSVNPLSESSRSWSQPGAAIRPFPPVTPHAAAPRRQSTRWMATPPLDLQSDDDDEGATPTTAPGLRRLLPALPRFPRAH